MTEALSGIKTVNIAVTGENGTAVTNSSGTTIGSLSNSSLTVTAGGTTATGYTLSTDKNTCTLTSSLTGTGTTLTFLNLDVGSANEIKTVTITLTDAAGNTSTVAATGNNVATITLDNIAPVLNSAVFTGNTDAAERVWVSSLTGNTLTLNITETATGIKTIVSGTTSTNGISFASVTGISVGGTALTDSQYGKTASTITIASNISAPYVKGTSVAVVISGVTIFAGTARNYSNITLTDYAGTSGTAVPANVCCDTNPPYFETNPITLTDNGTGDISGITAASGYTNNTSITLAAARLVKYSDSSTVWCSGLRSITLTGAKFTASTVVTYTNKTSVNSLAYTVYAPNVLSGAQRITYASGATTASVSTGASTQSYYSNFALSNNNQTLTLVTPANLCGAITFTNVELCESSTSTDTATTDGSKTVNVTLASFAGKTSDDSDAPSTNASLATNNIILDTTAPTVSKAPYMVSGTTTDGYTYNVYPRAGSTGVSTVSSGSYYFYTSVMADSSDTTNYCAKIGFGLTDETKLNTTNTYCYTTTSGGSYTLVSTAASGTTATVSQFFDAGTSSGGSTTYYVCAVDNAGNLSAEVPIVMVCDTGAPSLKSNETDSLTNAFTIADTGSTTGEEWRVNRLPTKQDSVSVSGSSLTGLMLYNTTDTKWESTTSGSLYNVYINNVANHKASDSSRAQLTVDLSNYTERNPSATQGGLAYYAITAAYKTAPASSSDTTAYTADTSVISGYAGDSGSFNQWIPYTAGTTTATVMMPAGYDCGPLFLALMDSCGNTSYIQIRTASDETSGYNIAWIRDGSAYSSAPSVSSYTGDTSSKNYLDGTLMVSNSINYCNDNAKLIETAKEDHAYTSDSTATSSAYAFRSLIYPMSSATTPTKAAVDSAATAGTYSWNYFTATAANTTITITDPYPANISGSYLYFVLEDAVGNFYATQLTNTVSSTNYPYWTYDNTAPTIGISAYPAAPTGKQLYAYSTTSEYYPANTTISFTGGDTYGITGYKFSSSTTAPTSWNTATVDLLTALATTGSTTNSASVANLYTYFSADGLDQAVAYLWVRDIVGNTSKVQILTSSSASTSQTWTYDGTAPAITYTQSGSANEEYIADSGTIKGYSVTCSTSGAWTIVLAKGVTEQTVTIPSAWFTDAGTGVRGCSFTNNAVSGVTSGSWTLSLTSVPAESSPETTKFYVYDNAGNTAEQSLTYYYSASVPKATLTFSATSGAYSADSGKGGIKSTTYGEYSLVSNQDTSAFKTYTIYTSADTVTPSIVLDAVGGYLYEYKIWSEGSGTSTLITSNNVIVSGSKSELTLSSASFDATTGSGYKYGLYVKNTKNNYDMLYFSFIKDASAPTYGTVTATSAVYSGGLVSAGRTLASELTGYIKGTSLSLNSISSIADTGGSGLSCYSLNGAATVTLSSDTLEAQTFIASATGTANSIVFYDNAGNSSTYSMTLYTDDAAPSVTAVAQTVTKDGSNAADSSNYKVSALSGSNGSYAITAVYNGNKITKGTGTFTFTPTATDNASWFCSTTSGLTAVPASPSQSVTLTTGATGATATFYVYDYLLNCATVTVTWTNDSASPTANFATNTNIYMKESGTSASTLYTANATAVSLSGGTYTGFVKTTGDAVLAFSSVSDAGAGLSGVTAAAGTDTATSLIPLNEVYSVTLTAGTPETVTLTDQVGNSTVYYITLTGDVTGPSATVTTSAKFYGKANETTGLTAAEGTLFSSIAGSSIAISGAVQAASDTLTFTVADAGAGTTLSSSSFTSTTGTVTVANGTVEFSGLSESTATDATITIADYLGNQSTYAVSLKADQTAPSATVTTSAKFYGSVSEGAKAFVDATGSIIGTAASGTVTITGLIPATSDTLTFTVTDAGAGTDMTNAAYVYQSTTNSAVTVTPAASPTVAFASLSESAAQTATITIADYLGNQSTYAVSLTEDISGPTANGTTGYGTYADSTPTTYYYYATGSNSISISSGAAITAATVQVDASVLNKYFADAGAGISGYSTSTTGAASTADLVYNTNSSFYAIDALGNYTEIAVSWVTAADTTGPVATGGTVTAVSTTGSGTVSNCYITATSGAVTIYYNGSAGYFTAGTSTVTFSPTATDDSAVAGYALAEISPFAIGSTASSITLTIGADASTSTYYAYDVYGNETAVTVTWTADSTCAATNSNGKTRLTFTGTVVGGIACTLNGLTKTSASYGGVGTDSGVKSITLCDADGNAILEGGQVTAFTDTSGSGSYYQITANSFTLASGKSTGTSYTIKYCIITDMVGNVNGSMTIPLYAKSSNTVGVSVTITSASSSIFGRTATGISIIATNAGDAITTAATNAAYAVKTVFSQGWDTATSFVANTAEQVRSKFTGGAKDVPTAVHPNVAGAAGERNVSQQNAVSPAGSARRDFAAESSAADGVPQMTVVDASKPIASANIPVQQEQGGALNETEVMDQRMLFDVLRVVLAALIIGVAVFIMVRRRKR